MRTSRKVYEIFLKGSEKKKVILSNIAALDK